MDFGKRKPSTRHGNCNIIISGEGEGRAVGGVPVLEEESRRGTTERLALGEEGEGGCARVGAWGMRERGIDPGRGGKALWAREELVWRD